MGLATSSPSPSASPWPLCGSATSGSDIIRRCHCFNKLTLERQCYRHSLTFNMQPDRFSDQFRHKKKRSYGFATFKKKLIGKRRHCKGSDHGKSFREHFLDCSSDVLKSLLLQYDSLSLLKDLCVQAQLSRPPALTLGQSLGELLESEACCDLVLCYRGVQIPVHRPLLMARCPLLSRLVSRSHSGEQLQLRTRNYLVSTATLQSVVHFLYSGNAHHLSKCADDFAALEMLKQEFGAPNSLQSDMSFLLDSGSLADCRLIFCRQDHQDVLLCHRAILAARSPFFRRLMQRRLKADQPLLCANGIMDICLDGEVLPFKYGKLVLHAMYLDLLDLRLIVPEESAGAGCPNVTDAGKEEHAMNLFEIGRFLEFSFLSQSCEDLLMQLLSLDNVCQILEWGLKPYGSSWIARQAFQFLEEEFYAIANSDILYRLDASVLEKLLQSDFLQASEAEILQALIRWGEFQLNSRTPSHGPMMMMMSSSLAASTLTRRRDQKQQRDVCDSELKELLSTLVPFVRIPHVLARDKNAEVLHMAMARNLFPVLPNFTSQLSCTTKYSPWNPRCSSGLYVRPRLFLPYVEECKNMIRDRCGPDPELISSSSPCLVNAPDTLSMLKSRQARGDELASGSRAVRHTPQWQSDEQELESMDVQNTRPLDQDMISKMMERLQKLLHSAAVQRALSSNFISQQEIFHLVQLRVVREFNLPDSYSSTLKQCCSQAFRLDCCGTNAAATLCPHQAMQTNEQTSWMMSSDASECPATDLHSLPSSSSSPVCGPDVTLSTNAMSMLSLRSHHPEPGSPDLVSMEGQACDSVSVGRRPLFMKHRPMPKKPAQPLGLARRHSQTLDPTAHGGSYLSTTLSWMPTEHSHSSSSHVSRPKASSSSLFF